MRRKTAGKSYKPRICVACDAPIGEQRPPYLVAHGSGRITGPYHASCAERISIAAARHHADLRDVVGNDVGRMLPRREETLPW